MAHGHGGSDQLGWRMEGSIVEVADILSEFARQLRGGDVTVWKGQRELHLDPLGRVEMSVDAVADDNGREGLHIKMHWSGNRPELNALGGGAAPDGEPPRPM